MPGFLGFNLPFLDIENNFVVNDILNYTTALLRESFPATMNTNAKKRKPPTEQKPAAAAPKQTPKTPQETSGRKRELRKLRKLRKIKINAERIFQERTKLLAKDADTRKEIEKIVAKLDARQAKSKRGHRKLKMYKNMLSGNFTLEKSTGPKKANKKPAKK
ncbi:hypothetical protein FQR65_LT14493 [Abscondita terminalis]|nr:hypothetical protein FQR65_LT14493 [Abscondita terminalis]